MTPTTDRLTVALAERYQIGRELGQGATCCMSPPRAGVLASGGCRRMAAVRRSTADAPHNPWNIDLAPDGKTTVYNAVYQGWFNLESFVLDSTRAQRDLANSPGLESFGRFDPEGRAVSYESDESGRFEVYVRPFPESGGRVQVSTNGGRRGSARAATTWSST